MVEGKKLLFKINLKLQTEEIKDVYVYKSGKSVWLDEHLVHPQNQDDIDRWIREYEKLYNVKVVDHQVEYPNKA